ncbi:MAG: hypothetical protein U0270_29660 [Labilithrix sp.]
MIRRAHGIVGGAVTLVLAVFLGCSDDREIKQLAEGCSINSDCTDPLACAFGRCHIQCTQTRDCPAGTLCVSAGSAKVCQLPEEARCDATKLCPFGLVCTDATCRNGCQANAECTVAGQECARGACYDRVAELDGGPLPSFPADASEDAGEDARDAAVFVGQGPLGFSTSNFDPKLVETVADAGKIENLETKVISGSCDTRCLPAPTLIDMGNGVHADLYAFEDFIVEQSATLYFSNFQVTNPRPVIIAVSGKVDIQGLLDVSAALGYLGPGGFGGTSPGPGFGGLSGFGNVGGGGGSYCGKGGFGIGNDKQSSLDTSKTYGTPELIPLVGGSAGAGNNGDVTGQGRGAGGGVIQIAARGEIIVREFGAINAGGGGGIGGGSAGGSGGAILLEAPAITILGAVTANGGGGSAGPDAQGGRASDQPAQGSNGVGRGGDGSAGATINGGDGTQPTPGGSASGGGGAGRIRLNTATGSATIKGIVSPSLGTPCATQGTLKP